MPADFQSLLSPLIRPAGGQETALSQGDRDISADTLSDKITGRPPWADITGNHRPRVAVTGPTDLNWLITVLSGLYHGVDIALMDDHLPVDDRSAILNTLMPDAVMTSDGAYDLPLDCPIYPTDDVVRGAKKSSNAIDPDPDQRLIFHTSGTTGVPKWVPLTADNIAHQVRSLDQTGLLPPGAGVANPLPLFHVYPFVIGFFYPLIRQGKVILPIKRNAAGILQLIRREDSRILIGVPQLYDKLIHGFLNRLSGVKGGLINAVMALATRSDWMARFIGKMTKRAKVINLDLVASGGAALKPSVHRQLTALGLDLAAGYGLTETSPLVSWNLPDDHRPGSAGRALPEVSIKIADTGEILVQGPNVFDGYLSSDRHQSITEDGYFKTGDRGRLDADGYLWVTGRMDRRITLPSGKNIDPTRVEEVIEELAQVELAGLILTDQDKLILYVQAADQADHKPLRAGVKRVLKDFPSHYRPAKVRVLDELPTTTLGKLRRHRLGEQQARD
jgi:long-chain acyl-CoA synthetase